MVQEQFSNGVAERWVEIRDFPGYSVSDHGRFMNTITGANLRVSVNTKGLAMIGLMQQGVQRKKSVPLLVATAYLRPNPNREFDTPINLDGDKMNNHYTNLEWRPLWFARRYSQQFTDGHPTFEYPIEDVETGERYKNSMHASTTNGVLDIEIYLSMTNNTYVWPTGQIFRETI